MFLVKDHPFKTSALLRGAGRGQNWPFLFCDGFSQPVEFKKHIENTLTGQDFLAKKLFFSF